MCKRLHIHAICLRAHIIKHMIISVICTNMRKGNKFFRKPTFNSLYDPFGSPYRGQKPSLPLRKAPPLTPTLSPSGKREETAPPRRSEPLRSKVGGPSKVSPDCTGWDRMGMTGYSLYPGNLLITCRFLVVFLVVSRKKRNFGGKLYKLNNSSFACKPHTP